MVSTSFSRMFLKAIAAATLIGAASAEPLVRTVLNGASYSAAIAPGSWVAIFGYDLAPAPASASGALTTTLAGVSVTVAGVPALVSYVSGGQVNALVPLGVPISVGGTDEHAADPVVPLTVKSPAGTSAPFNVRVSRNAPAIFTRNGAGTGRALFFDAGFKDLDTVIGGETAVFYATGLGPVDASGKVIDPVEVYVGERAATVLSATLAPGFPGVYQVNITTPAPATDRLFVRAGGWQSNIAEIGIRPGTNVVNATGDIEGLYPSTDPFFTLPPCNDEFSPTPCGAGQTFSVIMHAAVFHVSVDIAPSASPFYVAAVTEGGSSLILVDPAAGTYNASVSTISRESASGDFSRSASPLWDYFSCSVDALCSRFPGNIIPASRMTPWWGRAVNQLAPPTTPTGGSPNAVAQVSGKLTGSRFVVDDSTNSSLSRFGGFVQVPFGPFPQLKSTMKLYVDGRLVASTDIPYRVVYRVTPIE